MSYRCTLGEILAGSATPGEIHHCSQCSPFGDKRLIIAVW
uniref:Uncharacterized protein n=1 Tax=Anguilla anguilla TaxID=7936 RepID=A0A0E9P9Q0_ANGAN